jgi:hypothetical protein
VTTFRNILELNPQDARTRFGLGLALSEMGEHRDALRELELASTQRPTDSTITAGRGYSLARAGRKKEALGVIREFEQLAQRALGLVLREMATGRRSQEISGPPTPFTNIVAGCLAADPADRWQSAADIKKQLVDWPASPASQAVGTSPSRIPWMIAAAATLAFFAMLVMLLHREAPIDSGISQFAISLGNVTNLPVLSPDGRYFAFVSRDSSGASSLWIRTLSSVDAHVLPGTEGATAPLWSPDGKWLAFFANGKLKKIKPGGGPPQTIAALSAFQDGTWGPGGEILFRTDNRQPLSLIRDTGGSVKPLIRLNHHSN